MELRPETARRTIVDAGDEPLLEHPREMRPVHEAGTPVDLPDQLERRLRVAVLEILLAQPEAVRPQQQVPSGLRDERDLLDGVGGAAGSLPEHPAG